MLKSLTIKVDRNRNVNQINLIFDLSKAVPRNSNCFDLMLIDVLGLYFLSSDSFAKTPQNVNKDKFCFEFWQIMTDKFEWLMRTRSVLSCACSVPFRVTTD